MAASKSSHSDLFADLKVPCDPVRPLPVEIPSPKVQLAFPAAFLPGKFASPDAGKSAFRAQLVHHGTQVTSEIHLGYSPTSEVASRAKLAPQAVGKFAFQGDGEFASEDENASMQAADMAMPDYSPNVSMKGRRVIDLTGESEEEEAVERGMVTSPAKEEKNGGQQLLPEETEDHGDDHSHFDLEEESIVGVGAQGSHQARDADERNEPKSLGNADATAPAPQQTPLSNGKEGIASKKRKRETSPKDEWEVKRPSKKAREQTLLRYNKGKSCLKKQKRPSKMDGQVVEKILSVPEGMFVMPMPMQMDYLGPRR